MVLTEREKRQLDEIIKGILDNACTNDETLSYSTIWEQLTIACSLQSVVASVGRVMKRNNYWLEIQADRERKTKTFKVARPEIIISNDDFVKDKNILTFSTSLGTLTYDFITKTFNHDIKGKSVVDRSGYFEDFEEMCKYEWIFNYTDNLGTVYGIVYSCDKTYYEKMPQGLYQWLQETHNDLSADSLKEYVSTVKYGRAGWNIIKTFEKEIASFILDTLTMKVLNKIIYNDIKNGIYNIEPCTIRQFVNGCRQLMGVYSLEELIDTNRGLADNIKSMRKIADEKKNEILEKQLQRLNFINHTIYGEYEIVVPQTQIDKQEEGRMQHNCVGYYYDDSIMRGDNLIYFIRKAENNTKSFVTCRYNTTEQRTVEYRKCNNSTVTEQIVLEIIGRVTETIKANLQ